MVYFISNQKRVFTDKIQEATIQDCINYFKDKTEIGVDTETEGFDPYTNKVLTLQLGDFEHQYVIDCSTVSMSNFKELFQDTSKVFLFHNAKFDLKFLYHNGIKVSNVYDTFLAECVLTTGYEERNLALKDLALHYCSIDLDKTIRGTIHREGLTERVIVYGADDTKYLGKIKEKQLPKIKQFELDDILNLENKVVKVFALMEYNGAPLNTKKWLSVTEQVEKNVAELEKELDTLVYKEGTKDLPKSNNITKYCNIWKQGNLFFDDKERDCNINWASPAQKLSLLRNLGINIDSVGDKELQAVKNNHPIVPLLIQYSKQNKLATSFGKEFLKYINPITKRVHGNIWQILSTGRISISEPNINQIPSHGPLASVIRSAFEAPEGYKFVGGDYGQMELRIIAEFSQDLLWIKTFKDGIDLHSALCAATFNIPIEDVKKPFPPKPDLKYRDVQKTVDFGLAFGMSEFKLSSTIQVSVKEAKELIKKFFKVVPAVEKFLTALGELGRKRGFIATPRPFRRIRWFQNWKDAVETQDFKVLGEIERKSKNFPIQSTNANITKLAMVNLQEIIDANEYPVQIVMQVYDELQCIVREDFAEEFKVILETEMIKAAQEIIKTIPIEVDCKVNQYWEK